MNSRAISRYFSDLSVLLSARETSCRRRGRTSVAPNLRSVLRTGPRRIMFQDRALDAPELRGHRAEAIYGAAQLRVEKGEHGSVGAVVPRCAKPKCPRPYPGGLRRSA